MLTCHVSLLCSASCKFLLVCATLFKLFRRLNLIKHGCTGHVFLAQSVFVATEQRQLVYGHYTCLPVLSVSTN